MADIAINRVAFISILLSLDLVCDRVMGLIQSIIQCTPRSQASVFAWGVATARIFWRRSPVSTMINRAAEVRTMVAAEEMSKKNSDTSQPRRKERQ